MTGDIIEYLAVRSFDKAKTSSQAIAVFNKLKLPIPQEGEFFQTDDGGAVVLISPYACVLRFTSEVRQHFVHTRILQPLLTLPANEFRADLNPGVSIPFHGNDYTEWYDIYCQMENELKDDGIKVNDINHENGGRLPLPFDDHFIFIEQGDISRLNVSVLSNQKFLKRLPDDDPQVVLFGNLKKRFCEAQNNNDISFSWGFCKEMKEQGVLVANWEKNNHGNKGINKRYGGTQVIADAYARHI